MLSSFATLVFCVSFLSHSFTVDAHGHADGHADVDTCTIDGYQNHTCIYDLQHFTENCSTVVEAGCVQNKTEYCGNYTKVAPGRFIKSGTNGTTATYLDLLKFYSYSSELQRMERDGNYWVVSNISSWSKYAGDKVNTSYYDELGFNPSDLLITRSGNGGYNTPSNASFPKNFSVMGEHYMNQNFSVTHEYTVLVSCGRSERPQSNTTRPQSNTTQPQSNTTSAVKHSLVITLPGDLTTLTENQKTALKLNVQANIVTLTNLNVDDIDEIILSAGSIKATVIFKESVSKENAESAKTSLAASSAMYLVGTSTVQASGYNVPSTAAPPAPPDSSDSSASILKHNMLISVSFVIMTLSLLY